MEDLSLCPGERGVRGLDGQGQSMREGQEAKLVTNRQADQGIFKEVKQTKGIQVPGLWRLQGLDVGQRRGFLHLQG